MKRRFRDRLFEWSYETLDRLGGLGESWYNQHYSGADTLDTRGYFGRFVYSYCSEGESYRQMRIFWRTSIREVCGWDYGMDHDEYVLMFSTKHGERSLWQIRQNWRRNMRLSILYKYAVIRCRVRRMLRVKNDELPF
jgi:hypothetical protein